MKLPDEHSAPGSIAARAQPADEAAATLSAAAKQPARPRTNLFLRTFSNIRLGILWLTLILIYASIASALPQVRGYIEMSEMEIFQHWTFLVLILLFSFTLIVTTVTRIRWNWTNAGVLTTHVGLLFLVLGSAWYFWEKVEGDVRLDSPRVEIVDSTGQPVRGAKVLAEAEQSWSTFMPVLGGRVTLLVRETRGIPVEAVDVLVQVGEGEPRRISLSAAQPAGEPLTDRFRVRFVPGTPQSTFYDRDLAALVYRRSGDAEPRKSQLALRGLPIHRERFLPGDAMPLLPNNAAVVSHRTRSVNFLGLEHWRMPLTLSAADLPFDISVTGYLPYVRGLMQRVGPGGEQDEENPAVQVALSDGRGTSREQTLVARSPAQSRLDTLVPVEFRYLADDAALDDWLSPLAGAHELTVEVLDPPLKKTLAITQGEKVVLEGTPYVLSIDSLQDDWPLISPGYEGARSAALTVTISRGDARFTRTVIERFPEMSQDIDDHGMRRRDGLFDPNIVLRYRGVHTMKLLIGATPTSEPVLGVVGARGQVDRYPLPLTRTVTLPFGGQVTLKSFHRRSRVELVPVVEPVMFRRPGMDRQLSAIRLEFRGRRADQGWRETRWALFTPYPDDERRPLRVQPPGSAEVYEFVYSRFERELGVTLHPGKLTVTFFPGRQAAERWRSDFWVSAGAGQPEPAAVYTNQTATAGAWTFFQSGAANDRSTGDFWSYTILGVGNRQGIWPMLLGCVLIPLGSCYAFYIKPVLIRRRKEKALAEARATGQLPTVAAQPPRELVGASE